MSSGNRPLGQFINNGQQFVQSGQQFVQTGQQLVQSQYPGQLNQFQVDSNSVDITATILGAFV